MNNDLDIFHEEKLHEDLQSYIFYVEGLGQVLQHPLIYSVPYSPMLNKILNAQYRFKIEQLKTASPSKYVFLHERAWRFSAFLTVVDNIEDHNEYWSLLGEVWVDSENIYQYFDKWVEQLSSDHPGKKHFMLEEERKKLATLSDDLVIYRGYSHEESKFGLSWTSNKDIAEWFVKRLLRNRLVGKVLVGKVKKSKVIAYLNRRGEDEIIVLPDDIRVIKTIKVNR